MNHNTILIIKRLFLSIGLLAFAAHVMAHGGFDHVIGTVVKIENNVLSVKTAKGNVDVRLNEKTEITRNDRKAELADLKPGIRVVVEVPVNSKDRVAQAIKIGVATGAHAHSAQQ